MRQADGPARRATAERATRRLPRDTTRRLRPGTTDRAGSAFGAAGRSRPGRGGTRCAVRCDAGRPGTGSCARSAAPHKPGRSGRSGWPTPTRPTPAGPACTGVTPTTPAKSTTPPSSPSWPTTTGGRCPPRPRRCLRCWRCARPGRGSRPGTVAPGPPRPAGRCTPGSLSCTSAAARSTAARAGHDALTRSSADVTPVTTVPGRVIGAKPAAVCRWIFDLLGAAPGDTLTTCPPHPRRALTP